MEEEVWKILRKGNVEENAGGGGRKACVHNQRRHSSKDHKMRNDIERGERLLCLEKAGVQLQ